LLRKRLLVLLMAAMMGVTSAAPAIAVPGVNQGHQDDDDADRDQGGGNDHIKQNQGKGNDVIPL
jgi:hypothetical protein